jgi:hypothetical protein
VSSVHPKLTASILAVQTPARKAMTGPRRVVSSPQREQLAEQPRWRSGEAKS